MFIEITEENLERINKLIDAYEYNRYKARERSVNKNKENKNNRLDPISYKIINFNNDYNVINEYKSYEKCKKCNEIIINKLRHKCE